MFLVNQGEKASRWSYLSQSEIKLSRASSAYS